MNVTVHMAEKPAFKIRTSDIVVFELIKIGIRSLFPSFPWRGLHWEIEPGPVFQRYAGRRHRGQGRDV